MTATANPADSRSQPGDAVARPQKGPPPWPTASKPRFHCPGCGRLISATTVDPFWLGFAPGSDTYHYLHRHHRPDGTPCPTRSVRHRGRHLTVVPQLPT